ncbi:MAG: Holliday junction resolvase RecU [Mycoplasmatota bacterium]|nr:Holliday junction resolvase RecU [Mycoplasmatota bacterium]
MITIKNNKLINYGNRGMTLEDDINLTNNYYKEKDIALIYKKPIPIKVLKINETKTRIKDGFYEQKSTLDYSGIYKEKYLEFDAKETNSKTSFSILNIQPHQIEHIKNIIHFKGISFLIIRFNLLNETYLLEGHKLLAFLEENERKSIPLSYFQENCPKIALKYAPRLDYLKVIDIL